MTDIHALADQMLPLHGPYSPERMHTAAELLAVLVHRLNVATLGQGPEPLPGPEDVDRLLRLLACAVSELPQLFKQLDMRLEREPAGLLVVAQAWGPFTAQEAINAARYNLFDAARHAETLHRSLVDARTWTARLTAEDVT